MDRDAGKKKVLNGGMAILVLTLLLAGLIVFGMSAQATGSGTGPANHGGAKVIPLSTYQEEDKDSGSAADDDSGPGMRFRDNRVRWNGQEWEYSEDGGQTWTTTPPDGVETDEDGGTTIWRGEGSEENFDRDAFMREMDNFIDSILSDIEE